MMPTENANPDENYAVRSRDVGVWIPIDLRQTLFLEDFVGLAEMVLLEKTRGFAVLAHALTPHGQRRGVPTLEHVMLQPIHFLGL